MNYVYGLTVGAGAGAAIGYAAGNWQKGALIGAVVGLAGGYAMTNIFNLYPKPA